VVASVPMNATKETFPSVAHKLSVGSEAWTNNGKYEAGEIVVIPDSSDPKFILLTGVSRRNRRAMNCGFKMTPVDMDALCVLWLESRGVATPPIDVS
jgi:hypothetical protein